MRHIDPKRFGISSRTVLYKDGKHRYVIEILRKSRLIMKDAKIIFKKSQAIRDTTPEAVVCLRTNAPVCRKSIAFLHDHGIDLIEVS